MTDPRYPIGAHELDPDRSPAKRSQWIEAMRAVPDDIRLAVSGLEDYQLATPYRDGGWTLRQVVHHVADSHLNAHTRFRLALTEDFPTIRPYDEKVWADLPDARDGVLEPSLQVIWGIHGRMVELLEGLTDAQFARPLNHPEAGRMTVEDLLDIYQWHGRHHIAHITTTAERHDW